MFHRLCPLSKNHSFFLFGPRGSGKSTLLKEIYKDEPDIIWIDLLDPIEEEAFIKNPRLLIERWEIKKECGWIVIDEIQKVPKLLDLVHLMIEKHRIKFALTGSSARKLKRGGANLLAGRAFVFNLYPLTSFELKDSFNLNCVLQYGLLPEIFHIEDTLDKNRFLKAYALTYLKEEILVEGLLRKAEPFRKFLEVAATSNGEIINYSNIARDCAVDFKTVQSYYEILQDTLVGTYLDSYARSVRTKQISAPKFYFFDTGLVRALKDHLEVPLKASTYSYGRVFEHFIFLECFKLNHYMEKNFKFSFLKTADGLEVDLIIETPSETFFIEIKSSKSVSQKDLKHLRKIKKEIRNSRCYVLSCENTPRLVDDIKIMPWHEGIMEIFEFENFF